MVNVGTHTLSWEGTNLTNILILHRKFSETDIINMFEFLIDNIFAMFDRRIFQQTVSIPMGTNCAPLLADLLLYSYKADVMEGLLKENERKIVGSFNFMFRYIDDVLSLSNLNIC